MTAIGHQTTVNLIMLTTTEILKKVRGLEIKRINAHICQSPIPNKTVNIL